MAVRFRRGVVNLAAVQTGTGLRQAGFTQPPTKLSRRSPSDHRYVLDAPAGGVNSRSARMSLIRLGPPCYPMPGSASRSARRRQMSAAPHALSRKLSISNLSTATLPTDVDPGDYMISAISSTPRTANSTAATFLVRSGSRNLAALLPTNTAKAATAHKASVAPERDRQRIVIVRCQSGGAELGEIAPFGNEHDQENDPQGSPKAGRCTRFCFTPQCSPPSPPDDAPERGTHQKEHARPYVHRPCRERREQPAGRDRDHALKCQREARPQENGQRS